MNVPIVLLACYAQTASVVEAGTTVDPWSAFEGTDKSGGVILSRRTLAEDLRGSAGSASWMGYIAADSLLPGNKLQVITSAMQG